GPGIPATSLDFKHSCSPQMGEGTVPAIWLKPKQPPTPSLLKNTLYFSVHYSPLSLWGEGPKPQTSTEPLTGWKTCALSPGGRENSGVQSNDPITNCPYPHHSS